MKIHKTMILLPCLLSYFALYWSVFVHAIIDEQHPVGLTIVEAMVLRTSNILYTHTHTTHTHRVASVSPDRCISQLLWQGAGDYKVRSSGTNRLTAHFKQEADGSQTSAHRSSDYRTQCHAIASWQEVWVIHLLVFTVYRMMGHNELTFPIKPDNYQKVWWCFYHLWSVFWWSYINVSFTFQWCIQDKYIVMFCEYRVQ